MFEITYLDKEISKIAISLIKNIAKATAYISDSLITATKNSVKLFYL